MGIDAKKSFYAPSSGEIGSGYWDVVITLSVFAKDPAY